MPTVPQLQRTADRETSRRRLLQVALVGTLVGSVLAGCGSGLGAIRWDDDEPPEPLVPGPDELARRRAVASASALRAACAGLATEHPEVAAGPAVSTVLQEVSGQHGEHLLALGADPQEPAQERDREPTQDAQPQPTGDGAVEAPAAATDDLTGSGTGADPAANLVTQHTAAASEAMTDALTAGGPMARLLTQVAAARAVQATVLSAALQTAEPPLPVPVAAPPPASDDPAGDGSPTSATANGSVTSTSTSTGASVTDDTAQALTAALEGEHAARYGFELVATRLEGAERERAQLAVAACTSTAEQLAAVLEASGRQAPVPAPGYRVPGPLPDAVAARALAAQLDTSRTALAADVVALSQGPLRALAVDLVVSRALDAHRWGAAPTALPGA